MKNSIIPIFTIKNTALREPNEEFTQQGAHGSAQPPTSNLGRSCGDYRCAKEITEASLFISLTQKLASQPDLLALFKRHIGGDWTNKKLNNRERADIAANAERVLQYIDNATLDHSKRNGKIDGFKSAIPAIFNPQKQHLTLQGSEAWTLMDFCHRGYKALTSPDTHNQHYHQPHHYNRHSAYSDFNGHNLLPKCAQ